MRGQHRELYPWPWLALRLSLGGMALCSVLVWSDRTIATPLTATPLTATPLTELPTNDSPNTAPTEWNTDTDIPEEILRTEIITEARSPLTGEVLSAAEYAQLQATLASPAGDTLVSDDLQYLIFLLQFRRAVRPIVPFL